MKVDKAVKNLERYSDLIFGGKTSKDAANWKGFDDDFRSYTEKMEERFASSKQYGKYKDTKGLFYMHLGYAPVMKSKNPEKVKTEGYGEYGRIYRLFLRNEARLGRGLASFEVPCYSQKLWDDDKNNDGESDGLLGAPSIRSIGSIAMTIASGGAGAWAFAVNMLDDAVFTAMDVGNGITDWDDGMLSLGKQAGTSLVTSGIGGRFDKIETNNFLTSTAAAGVKTGSLNLAGTAINSFDLNSKGLYFNTNSFAGNWQDDLYGKGAVSGYISSMGAAGLNSTLTGFYGEDLAYGKALSGSIAGTAASMYEYNALGSTKLNVLNTSDILSFLGADKLKEDYGGVGLLEFGIGDGGSVFNFGTEGQNVSASNLSAAYKGINTYYQNMKIYSSEENNIREAKVGMRALYSRGHSDTEAEKLYNNLLSGTDNLEVGSKSTEEAETTLNNKGGRTIRVASLGDDRMSRLHLGIILGHEAHRDGEDNGALGQARETISSVFAHSAMAMEMERDYKGFIASDKTLIEDVNKYNEAVMTGDMSSFAGHVLDNYDMSADYWKLTRDGKLINDNKVALTWADTGEMVVENSETSSISQALTQYLGMERAEELLGSNLMNSDLYDTQTLKDVLKLSDSEINRIQHSGTLSGLAISESQMLCLAGEALMKNNGLEWENNGWYGNDNASFKITDKNLAGQITFSDTMKNGEFEKFTLTALVDRDKNSYKGTLGDLTNQALDRVKLEKRDLDGNLIGSHDYNGFQTVDIMNNKEKYNQPYKDPVHGNIQGNTIEAGTFWSRIGQTSNFPEKVWVIQDASTIDGTAIDSSGNASGVFKYNREGRSLWHQNRTKDQDKFYKTDFRNYAVDGCFGTSTDIWKQLNYDVYNWGARDGYDVMTVLEEK